MTDDAKLIKVASEFEGFIAKQIDAVGGHMVGMMMADVIGYAIGNGSPTLDLATRGADAVAKQIRQTAINVFLEKGKGAGHG